MLAHAESAFVPYLGFSGVLLAQLELDPNLDPEARAVLSFASEVLEQPRVDDEVFAALADRLGRFRCRRVQH